MFASENIFILLSLARHSDMGELTNIFGNSVGLSSLTSYQLIVVSKLLPVQIHWRSKLLQPILSVV